MRLIESETYVSEDRIVDGRSGFRRTELGLIPTDWDVARVDENASIKTGSRNTQDRIEDGEYPFFVRSQQVERINSYTFNGEAVLTAGDGVGTGKVFHYINGQFDVHQRVYRISNFSDRLSGRYFFYQFSTRFYDRIMSMTAKSSVDSVRMEMIGGMKIPLPPPREQRAIAEALMDVDELLGALDAVIAKKRAIKQGAMQQLLTGKTRLPGFNGEWRTVCTGELGRFQSGDGFPTALQGQTSGAYPFFKVSDMNNEGNETVMEVANNYISESQQKQLRASVFPPKSIVFAKIGAAVFLERKRILAKPSCLDNNMVACIVQNDIADHRFVHSVLLLTRLSDLVSTTALPSLSVSALSSIEIHLPPLKEQIAIASALSDMEAEISVLETRRDKTRAIKQGMMQQLLTGRIRLVKPQPTEAEA